MADGHFINPSILFGPWILNLHFHWGQAGGNWKNKNHPNAQRFKWWSSLGHWAMKCENCGSFQRVLWRLPLPPAVSTLQFAGATGNPVSPQVAESIVLDLFKFLLILGDFKSLWSTVFSHAEDTSETSMTSASGKVGESDQEPTFWTLAHNSLSHIAISLCQSGPWRLPLSFCSCIMIFSVCFPSYPQPADCWKAILRFVWYWCLVDEQCRKSLWWYCCLSWAARRKTAPAYGMSLS